MNKNEMNSKLRRAQGRKGLLSRSISVQRLNNPWLKTYPREEREEEQGGDREVAPGRRKACVWVPGSKGR